MSVYARFKKDHDGFRKLVELLESVAPSRRQKMVEVGIKEDIAYTQRALEYVMEFNDVLQMPTQEIEEICSKGNPQVIGYALVGQPPEVIDRFIQCAGAAARAKIRDYSEMKLSPVEVGGARLKVIGYARDLERRGLVKTKRIPSSF